MIISIRLSNKIYRLGVWQETGNRYQFMWHFDGRNKKKKNWNISDVLAVYVENVKGINEICDEIDEELMPKFGWWEYSTCSNLDFNGMSTR